MTAWLLSIIGMVFIGVVFEAVVPDGKTNSFIKSIFAVIFMFVVISPVINLLKNKNIIDFSDMFSSSETTSEEFAEHELLELKFVIENHLVNNGVNGVELEIRGHVTNNDTKVEKIYVNLSNLIINKKDEHIDKYKLITTLIKEKVEVDEEQIIYG